MAAPQPYKPYTFLKALFKTRLESISTRVGRQHEANTRSLNRHTGHSVIHGAWTMYDIVRIREYPDRVRAALIARHAAGLAAANFSTSCADVSEIEYSTPRTRH